MEELAKKARLLMGIVMTLAGVVVVLFVTLIAYHLNPAAFRASPVAENGSTPEASAPVATVPTAAVWHPRSIETDLPAGERGKQIRYGYQLISETPRWLGPHADEPALRLAGNELACKNCHLGAGTKAGAISFVGVAQRFPQFRGREGKMGTLEDRINGCMERSMNGQELPTQSAEMQAMVAYIQWLSEDVPEAKLAEYKGLPAFEIPAIKADTVQGKAIYEAQCQACHGTHGEGIRQPGGGAGYLYPPLWGADSYNHGAGMRRVLTAAPFIKANMPFGVSWENPRLTDEEALHVAAYINHFERPHKANTAEDFPDKKLKPVSTPYGPWEDPFPAEQHQYGPFPPIVDYYQKTFALKKTN
ncbi:thiosulfate dehydrogenase [Catalinimonas alkaloidigena]|uniref:Thiosulfate dehydrogenase n=1 Tax=Catalinimonas alkaloidigena TaxID=1075417 RepID=A0A1G9NZU2_9BACT|nr:c-type cytochrome [Catalinimonas alkaloidigena]SDL92142.1 thiosulfate dehydrogenase [Catalinimonas alkaloidigena]